MYKYMVYMVSYIYIAYSIFRLAPNPEAPEKEKRRSDAKV